MVNQTIGLRGSNKGRSMGYTEVLIKVENSGDWMNFETARKSRKKAKPVRTVIIPDAMVDTGTYNLCLPERYIKQLGLVAYPGKLRVQTANGYVERSVYGAAHLTIGDRSCEVQVTGLPDDVPALIGVIPLEAMDLLVDPVAEKLVGRHGDKQIQFML